MNLKFSTLLIGLSTLLFLQTKPLVGMMVTSFAVGAEPTPASHEPMFLTLNVAQSFF